MIKKVEEFINKTKMLNRGEHILIGCSGGPDSTALLHILYELSEKWEWRISVFYLDHGIRQGAGLEARFVERMAEKLSLPFYTDKIDAIKYSKRHKLSLEEGARELRYRIFERIRNEVSADKIALGHNLNDTVETFLMRLFQGSGVGLSGIPPVSGRIIRPLIELKRDEILEFLTKNGIDYLTDISNYSEKFLRNRVRMDIIPYIESVFPNAINTIGRSVKNISEIVSGMKNLLLKEGIIHKEGKWVFLDRERFFSLPEGARFIILKLSLEKLGLENSLKRAHLDKMNSFIQGTGAIKINQGVIYIGEKIFIFRDDDMLTKKPKTVSISGDTKFGNFLIKTEVLNSVPDVKNGDFYFDIDRIDLPLKVRTKKEGDKIVPFGMKGRKKIKKVFIDKKFPRPLRYIYPIIEDERGILIGGTVRTNRAKITKDTKKILKIRIQEWGENG